MNSWEAAPFFAQKCAEISSKLVMGWETQRKEKKKKKAENTVIC